MQTNDDTQTVRPGQTLLESLLSSWRIFAGQMKPGLTCTRVMGRGEYGEGKEGLMKVSKVSVKHGGHGQVMFIINCLFVQLLLSLGKWSDYEKKSNIFVKHLEIKLKVYTSIRPWWRLFKLQFTVMGCRDKNTKIVSLSKYLCTKTQVFILYSTFMCYAVSLVVVVRYTNKICFFMIKVNIAYRWSSPLDLKIVVFASWSGTNDGAFSSCLFFSHAL